MKRYNFRLESVLNYRIGLEREVQQELAECERKLLEEKQRMNMLQTEHVKTQTALKSREEKVLNLEALRMLSSYLYYLDIKIEEQEEIICACEKEVSQVQERVKVAMQQRETLEKFKEKDYRAFQAEVNAAESKVIDEAGLRMFIQTSSVSTS